MIARVQRGLARGGGMIGAGVVEDDLIRAGADGDGFHAVAIDAVTADTDRVFCHVGVEGLTGDHLVIRDLLRRILEIVVDGIAQVSAGRPLGSIGDGLSHGISNRRLPTGEDVAIAGRGTVERRGSSAGQKVFMHLIDKDFLTVHAVSVSHGVLFFLVVRGAVVVLVVFPLSDIGGVASYGRGNLGLPTDKDVVCAGRGTVERRGSGAGQEVAIHLIGKDLFGVHAVGIGHGVLRSHAQDIVLGRSVHRSPRAIFPFQVDNALLFTGFAGIGNVRTLHNAQLGIELLHILVEEIDLHFAGILAVVTNGERVVDQAEGLAAVVGFAVGADDLYRIVAQQLLDFFLAGLRGRGVAFNVNLSGIN